MTSNSNNSVGEAKGNYSRSEWGALSIQDRIKAMNAATVGDETLSIPNTDEISIMSMRTDYSLDALETDMPKRKSVVDIWRNRDSQKSAEKSVVSSSNKSESSSNGKTASGKVKLEGLFSKNSAREFSSIEEKKVEYEDVPAGGYTATSASRKMWNTRSQSPARAMHAENDTSTRPATATAASSYNASQASSIRTEKLLQQSTRLAAQQTATTTSASQHSYRNPSPARATQQPTMPLRDRKSDLTIVPARSEDEKASSVASFARSEPPQSFRLPPTPSRPSTPLNDRLTLSQKRKGRVTELWRQRLAAPRLADDGNDNATSSNNDDETTKTPTPRPPSRSGSFRFNRADLQVVIPKDHPVLATPVSFEDSPLAPIPQRMQARRSPSEEESTKMIKSPSSDTIPSTIQISACDSPITASVEEQLSVSQPQSQRQQLQSRYQSSTSAAKQQSKVQVQQQQHTQVSARSPANSFAAKSRTGATKIDLKPSQPVPKSENTAYNVQQQPSPVRKSMVRAKSFNTSLPANGNGPENSSVVSRWRQQLEKNSPMPTKKPSISSNGILSAVNGLPNSDKNIITGRNNIADKSAKSIDNAKNEKSITAPVRKWNLPQSLPLLQDQDNAVTEARTATSPQDKKVGTVAQRLQAYKSKNDDTDESKGVTCGAKRWLNNTKNESSSSTEAVSPRRNVPVSVNNSRLPPKPTYNKSNEASQNNGEAGRRLQESTGSRSLVDQGHVTAAPPTKTSVLDRWRQNVGKESQQDSSAMSMSKSKPVTSNNSSRTSMRDEAPYLAKSGSHNSTDTSFLRRSNSFSSGLYSPRSADKQIETIGLRKSPTHSFSKNNSSDTCDKNAVVEKRTAPAFVRSQSFDDRKSPSSHRKSSIADAWLNRIQSSKSNVTDNDSDRQSTPSMSIRNNNTVQSAEDEASKELAYGNDTTVKQNQVSTTSTSASMQIVDRSSTVEDGSDDCILQIITASSSVSSSVPNSYVSSSPRRSTAAGTTTTVVKDKVKSPSHSSRSKNSAVFDRWRNLSDQHAKDEQSGSGMTPVNTRGSDADFEEPPASRSVMDHWRRKLSGSSLDNDTSTASNNIRGSLSVTTSDAGEPSLNSKRHVSSSGDSALQPSSPRKLVPRKEDCENEDVVVTSAVDKDTASNSGASSHITAEEKTDSILSRWQAKTRYNGGQFGNHAASSPSPTTTMQKSVNVNSNTLQHDTETPLSTLNVPKATFLVLVSNQSLSRELHSAQSKVFTILTAKKIPYKSVDGADSRMKRMRDRLFAVSGLRGVYPQFFFTEGDDRYTYWGNEEDFLTANERGDLELKLKMFSKTLHATEQDKSTMVHDQSGIHAAADVKPHTEGTVHVSSATKQGQETSKEAVMTSPYASERNVVHSMGHGDDVSNAPTQSPLVHNNGKVAVGLSPSSKTAFHKVQTSDTKAKQSASRGFGKPLSVLKSYQPNNDFDLHSFKRGMQALSNAVEMKKPVLTPLDTKSADMTTADFGFGSQQSYNNHVVNNHQQQSLVTSDEMYTIDTSFVAIDDDQEDVTVLPPPDTLAANDSIRSATTQSTKKDFVHIGRKHLHMSAASKGAAAVTATASVDTKAKSSAAAAATTRVEQSSQRFASPKLVTPLRGGVTSAPKNKIQSNDGRNNYSKSHARPEPRSAPTREQQQLSKTTTTTTPAKRSGSPYSQSAGTGKSSVIDQLRVGSAEASTSSSSLRKKLFSRKKDLFAFRRLKNGASTDVDDSKKLSTMQSNTTVYKKKDDDTRLAVAAAAETTVFDDTFFAPSNMTSNASSMMQSSSLRPPQIDVDGVVDFDPMKFESSSQVQSPESANSDALFSFFDLKPTNSNISKASSAVSNGSKGSSALAKKAEKVLKMKRLRRRRSTGQKEPTASSTGAEDPFDSTQDVQAMFPVAPVRTSIEPSENEKNTSDNNNNSVLLGKSPRTIGGDQRHSQKVTQSFAQMYSADIPPPPPPNAPSPSARTVGSKESTERRALESPAHANKLMMDRPRLSNRYNLSSRFINTSSPDYDKSTRSPGSGKNAEATRPDSVSSVNTGSSELESLAGTHATGSVGTNGIHTVQNATKRKAKSDIISEEFVSQSMVHVEALKDAYSTMTLSQIAKDVADEVTLGAIDLDKFATNMNDQVSTFRQFVSGQHSIRSSDSQINNKIVTSPISRVSTLGDESAQDEEEEDIAIEVEYMDSVDEEDDPAADFGMCAPIDGALESIQWSGDNFDFGSAQFPKIMAAEHASLDEYPFDSIGQQQKQPASAAPVDKSGDRDRSRKGYV